MAALAVDPTLNAAFTTRKLCSPTPDNATLDALVAELQTQAQAVNDGNLNRGEAMLTSHAHALDAIFNICARQAALNAGERIWTRRSRTTASPCAHRRNAGRRGRRWGS